MSLKLNRTSGKDSENMQVNPKQAKPRMPNAMSYAHYLGFDFPKAKTAAKASSMNASAVSKPAATAKPAATRTPTNPTTTAPNAPNRTRTAMPFSEAIGLNGPAKAQRDADTLYVPEMVNRTMTGRFIEVERPKAEEPKLDSSSIASRILAVAKRAFGK